MKLPKPKECAERWDQMEPTDGGRVCGQCEKVIIDFRKMNWNDIRKIQNESSHSTCGVYSDKQISNWDPAPKSRKITSSAAAVLLTLSQLLSHDAKSQAFYVQTDTTLSPSGDDSTKVGTRKADQIIIKGQITNAHTGEVMPMTTITVQGQSYKTTSDWDGNYKLLIDQNAFTQNEVTIEVSYVGFETTVVKAIKKVASSKIISLDIKLSEQIHVNYFRAYAPSKRELRQEKKQNKKQ